MATALQGFRSSARSCICRQAPYRCATQSIGAGRVFSTTPRQSKDRRIEDVLSKAKASANPAASRLLRSEEALAEAKASDVVAEEWEQTRQKLHSRFPPPGLPQQRKKLKQTFMNMGETEPWEDEHSMDDDDDDMSSLAHGELEQHREMRHYARLAAWEMPLLSKLAKPFQPPSADMPLRFRYTTYMGEQHPAEKKVVLEFSPADMPGLTKVQAEKLRKLVGVRYNPEKDVVKISCEMFETQAQNKRYLGDMVDSLLREAKDATDTFEDIPLDTRHHHFKPKPRFPEEWKMTEERRAELVEYRRAMALKDQQLEITGQLIDGIKQIEKGLRKPSTVTEALPEMAMAGKGAKGKGKKLAVRR